MTRDENIDFCIRYLMEQNEAMAVIPKRLQDKKKLLRVMMNIWRPQPIDIEFLKAQDEELQKQLQDKGVVRTRERLWQGDITRLKVDAIVNAASSRGLGCWNPLHACVDNDIHSAAGLQLRQECDRILQGDTIAIGGAIVTPGYNLPAKWVIHTVGPVVEGDNPTAGQEEQLAGCYRTCLWLAQQHNCYSAAFSCISTGDSHFPNRRAAEIAVKACKDTRLRVIFVVNNDMDYDIYKELLERR